VFLTALATLRPGARVIASEDGTGTGAGAVILAGWGVRPPQPSTGRIVPPAAEGLPGLAEYRAAWRAEVG
jgi:hypothetical protein